MCNEWDYEYCEKNGLEFVIHYIEGELYFDTDYKDDIFLLDLGNRYVLVEPNETLNDILRYIDEIK